ncbi:MAG: dihydropteroate synthase [Planctomycetota bacterium]|nr:dihydropteroate synthase [Planctomycetota bacterium]
MIELDDILNSHRTGRAVVMGVLNVTPDSFSDGGEFFSPSDAVARARRIVAEGADVIDVGAESTRPGSDRVSAEEQLARLHEVIPAVAASGAILSIDTTSTKVAAFAMDCGAKIINDISAGRDDSDMFSLAASRGAAMVLMHMLGKPKTMQQAPSYQDVVVEVRRFLAERLDVAESAGLDRRRCIVDPGIGFGKRLEHNLALLAGVDRLLKLDVPVLIGASRKRFIGELTHCAEPADRVYGTVAASLAAWRRGATVFRVHDVAAVKQALAVARAIEQNAPAEKKTPR